MTGHPTYLQESEAKARLADIAKEEAFEETARKRARRNKDFIQLSNGAVSPLRGLISRSPKAAQILLCMVEYMGQIENALQADYEALKAMSGASDMTVRRSLALLKAEKWIEQIPGAAHTYRVNSSVFWESYGDRKEGTFQAVLNVPQEDRPIKINKKVSKKVMPVLTKKPLIEKPSKN
ncbi:MAG: hypothetical protein WCG50_17170 [Rhodoferax sp.]|uniref:hypothetical protein n=1 Tax=Rhodoferax sp. TaxID=50421 RepID=UPI003017230F